MEITPEKFGFFDRLAHDGKYPIFCELCFLVSQILPTIRLRNTTLMLDSRRQKGVWRVHAGPA